MPRGPKPRNPVARSPLLRKGGAHQRSPSAGRQQSRREIDDLLEDWEEALDDEQVDSPDPARDNAGNKASD